ncbi:DNA-binding transcriptional regulator GalS (plasmid) [Saccharobesus litoralis]|uniref:DNA-binding transcriptional regulator GalS n=1 Tax=Saccharobesus litoralis TaxID=2172099 RepID=A0A2S0VY90_9ALTE|nr:substrate-binding domain-containing protein [Saccharobesus litoralis]AWB69163.1 DNA-binding transcriptional regulator GalS [Saccharobesus litoralis]
MPTIKDVAKVAGVSTATVSRVVNGQGKVGEQCRARVTRVIKELGYKLHNDSPNNITTDTQVIGLVTPKISMAFFGLLAAGAEEAAREQGYNLLMCNSSYETSTELKAIESLRNQGCKSIILHSEYSDEEKLIQLCRDIPGLVLINRFISEVSERCVWFDNSSGAQKSANYLMDKGHKDFAIVSSIYQNGDPSARVLGVKQALYVRGIEIDNDLVIESTANIDGGYEATKQLIDSGKPFSAIVAFNDLMAIGAVHALTEAGIKVPDQVSVIGFDDLPIAKACLPKLTTMHYPVEEMAKYAVDLSLSLAKNEPKHSKQTHLFVADLVERASVAQV